jgi:hypothetical protein
LFDASYNQKDDIKKQKRKIKKGAKKLAEKDEKIRNYRSRNF